MSQSTQGEQRQGNGRDEKPTTGTQQDTQARAGQAAGRDRRRINV